LKFQVASKSSRVVTMLPNNDAVIACYTHPGGILEGVKVRKVRVMIKLQAIEMSL